MKTYKKFFIQTIISMLVATLAISILAAFCGNFFVGKKKLLYVESAQTNQWIVAKSEIAKMLDKSGPKLVFISGSNVLYGVNALKIEKETGIQTLNYGLHAGLVSYLFNCAKSVLKKNDTVFLPLEYEYYNDENEINPLSSTTIEYVIGYDNSYYRQLPVLKKLKVLLYMTNSDDSRKVMSKNDVVENHIDKRGDFVDNFGLNKKYSKEAVPYVLKINKLSSRCKNWELYKFIQWCKERDIKVYAFAPNVYHSSKLEAEELKSFEEIMKFYKLCGVEFIGKPEDGFFELKDMHDTVYHLNQEGQKIRTKYFIEKIQSIINR